MKAWGTLTERQNAVTLRDWQIQRRYKFHVWKSYRHQKWMRLQKVVFNAWLRFLSLCLYIYIGYLPIIVISFSVTAQKAGRHAFPWSLLYQPSSLITVWMTEEEEGKKKQKKRGVLDEKEFHWTASKFKSCNFNIHRALGNSFMNQLQTN